MIVFKLATKRQQTSIIYKKKAILEIIGEGGARPPRQVTASAPDYSSQDALQEAMTVQVVDICRVARASHGQELEDKAAAADERLARLPGACKVCALASPVPPTHASSCCQNFGDTRSALSAHNHLATANRSRQALVCSQPACCPSQPS